MLHPGRMMESSERQLVLVSCSVVVVVSGVVDRRYSPAHTLDRAHVSWVSGGVFSVSSELPRHSEPFPCDIDAPTISQHGVNIRHTGQITMAWSLSIQHVLGTCRYITTGTSTTRSRNYTCGISTVFRTVWMAGTWRCITTGTSTIRSMIRSEIPSW